MFFTARMVPDVGLRAMNFILYFWYVSPPPPLSLVVVVAVVAAFFVVSFVGLAQLFFNFVGLFLVVPAVAIVVVGHAIILFGLLSIRASAARGFAAEKTLLVLLLVTPVPKMVVVAVVLAVS